jgi:hypothetical protein
MKNILLNWLLDQKSYVMNMDLPQYFYCFRYGVSSDSLPNQPLPDVHYNWVDVTNEFFEAVKGMLHNGECS